MTTKQLLNQNFEEINILFELAGVRTMYRFYQDKEFNYDGSFKIDCNFYTFTKNKDSKIIKNKGVYNSHVYLVNDNYNYYLRKHFIEKTV